MRRGTPHSAPGRKTIQSTNPITLVGGQSPTPRNWHYLGGQGSGASVLGKSAAGGKSPRAAPRAKSQEYPPMRSLIDQSPIAERLGSRSDDIWTFSWLLARSRYWRLLPHACGCMYPESWYVLFLGDGALVRNRVLGVGEDGREGKGERGVYIRVGCYPALCVLGIGICFSSHD